MTPSENAHITENHMLTIPPEQRHVIDNIGHFAQFLVSRRTRRTLGEGASAHDLFPFSGVLTSGEEEITATITLITNENLKDNALNQFEISVTSLLRPSPIRLLFSREEDNDNWNVYQRTDTQNHQTPDTETKLSLLQKAYLALMNQLYTQTVLAQRYPD
jgi:hypothetical protein